MDLSLDTWLAPVSWSALSYFAVERVCSTDTHKRKASRSRAVVLPAGGKQSSNEDSRQRGTPVTDSSINRTKLKLAMLLHHLDAERVAALGRAGTADDVLELALLKLWRRLLQQQQQQHDHHEEQATSTSSSPASSWCSAEDRKVWGRLAQLLFAADSGVQRAAAAVAHAAALVPALHKSLWHSQWWQRVLEKLEDCSVATRADALEGGEQLLFAVGALLRTHASTAHANDHDDERAQEGFAILLRFSSSQSRRLAICATTELVELLRQSSTCRPSAQASQVLWSNDCGVHLIATELLQSARGCGGSTTTITSSSSSLANRNSLEESEELQLQCVRFDLLLAVQQQTVDLDDISTLHALGKIDVFTLGSRFLSHQHPALQEQALRLLRTTVLQQRERGSSALCASIRMSGLLISLCWLMGHSRLAVAAAAGELARAVVESSPATDILRAMIEQGCVIILSSLAVTESSAKQQAQALDRDGDQDDGESGDADDRRGWSCAQLLQWVTTELLREQGVLRAAASSVLRSSNLLLQKNVLLSLLLLSQRDAGLKLLLQEPDEEEGEWIEADFLSGVVLVAIDANEDGALATMLLSAALSWCDKSSALKLLDDVRGSFRQSKSHRLLLPDQEAKRQILSGEVASGLGKRDHSSIPPLVTIMCTQDAAVQVDGELLYTLSKFARRRIDDFMKQQLSQVLLCGSHPSAPPPLVRLPFDAVTAQLFADLLSKSQQEAAMVLKRKATADLLELLELAKALECSKCWHFATFALNHALCASNWFGVFEFAVRIRHPSLMLRAGRVALESHAELELHHKASSSCQNEAGDPTLDLSQLKSAAFMLYRELFGAANGPSDRQHDDLQV